MLRLQTKPPDSIYASYTTGQVRHYLNDSIQSNRILKVRQSVVAALKGLNRYHKAHIIRRMVELGCGVAEISGHFSWGHFVHGYDANPISLIAAAKAFPHADFSPADIQTLPARECDVLVMAELLEHLHDPIDVCARWLPLSTFCVISSPLEGDIDPDTKQPRDLSGGEHIWSFDSLDFGKFLKAGGHELIAEHTFPMGGYNCHVQLSFHPERAKSLSPEITT